MEFMTHFEHNGQTISLRPLYAILPEVGDRSLKELGDLATTMPKTCPTLASYLDGLVQFETHRRAGTLPEDYQPKGAQELPRAELETFLRALQLHLNDLQRKQSAGDIEALRAGELVFTLMANILNQAHQIAAEEDLASDSTIH